MLGAPGVQVVAEGLEPLLDGPLVLDLGLGEVEELPEGRARAAAGSVGVAVRDDEDAGPGWDEGDSTCLQRLSFSDAVTEGVHSSRP